MTRHPRQPYSPAPPSSVASVAEHIHFYTGSRLIGLRAVCNNVPLFRVTSATDNLAWGGSGETGLVGCLVMEGGGSQVDQETRTVHRGYPLFGVVQPPPFSEWGYVPRVFSAPASSRKSWGVPHVHLSLPR